MDTIIAKSLWKWACRNPDNRNTLEEWLDSAVADIASGKGSQVLSTTTNGMSVTFSNNGMTVVEWFNTLTKALEYFDNPPTSKITGRVI